MNPKEPFEPEWFATPKPAELFDSENRKFYQNEAFQIVAYDVIWTALCGEVRRLLRSFGVRAGAQDIASKAMLKTFERFPQRVCLRGTASERRQHFRNLLFRAARNETLSLVRSICGREKTMKVTSLEEKPSTIHHSTGSEVLQSGEDPNEPDAMRAVWERVIAKLSR